MADDIRKCRSFGNPLRDFGVFGSVYTKIVLFSHVHPKNVASNPVTFSVVYKMCAEYFQRVAKNDGTRAIELKAAPPNLSLRKAFIEPCGLIFAGSRLATDRPN